MGQADVIRVFKNVSCVGIYRYLQDKPALCPAMDALYKKKNTSPHISPDG